jgi:hypothetical protein
MKKGDLVTWHPSMSRYSGLLIVLRKHPDTNMFQCWDSRFGETGWVDKKHLVVITKCTDVKDDNKR